MKTIKFSITYLLGALIFVFVIYIIRNGRPTFRQVIGQEIANNIMGLREAFGVSPGTTYAFSTGTGGREAFGVSPGTLTQLAANHVPTAEDIPMLREWIAQRKEGIYQMTESDLINKAPIEYSILGNRIGAFA